MLACQPRADLQRSPEYGHHGWPRLQIIHFRAIIDGMAATAYQKKPGRACRCRTRPRGRRRSGGGATRSRSRGTGWRSRYVASAAHPGCCASDSRRAGRHRCRCGGATCPAGAGLHHDGVRRLAGARLSSAQTCIGDKGSWLGSWFGANNAGLHLAAHDEAR